MNTNNLFSKGCQLCQQGKWLCIYITYKCTAACDFCPAPLKNDEIRTAFGNDKKQILHYLKGNGFKGISFSGGDPFLAFDRLFDWFVFLKKEFPDFYFWVYTNGLAVSKEKLKILANAGMDEIRFNIAATGYLSPKIWQLIKLSRKYFHFVSIEIPSIKKDYWKLTEALKKIDKYGIDYLNLHDLIISEKDSITEKEPVKDFLLNKTILLRYSESSVDNTINIIEHAKQKGYKFQINHCSMQQKEEQMLQRRLKMGSIFNNPEYDIAKEDGVFYNYFEYQPDFINSVTFDYSFEKHSNAAYSHTVISRKKLMNQKIIGNKIVRAAFIPKMDINQEKIYIDWRIIKI